jgi:hypothetical protein
MVLYYSEEALFEVQKNNECSRVLLPQDGDSATFTHDTAASGNQHMAASQYISRSQLE